MATIKDVAREAGVSASTVSHVVNNTRVVADATRERVEAAISELGYIPNAMARSLKGSGSRVLGMLVTDSTNPFYANLIQLVDRAAYQQGYNLILCNTHGDAQCARDYLDMLMQRRIDGLLVMSADTALDGMEPVQQFADLPVVVMDWGPMSSRFDRLQDDSALGGYLATRHLLQAGHRRIGCLIGPLGKSNSQLRLSGYHQALSEAGITSSTSWLRETAYTCEGGYEAMQQLLELPDCPDALFCGNDLIAMGAIRAAHDAGLRVPDDLSIVGYDDIPQSAYMVPPLTTVRQPAEQLAAEAINLILRRLAESQQSEQQPGQVIKLAPTLTERSSVAERAVE